MSDTRYIADYLGLKAHPRLLAEWIASTDSGVTTGLLADYWVVMGITAILYTYATYEMYDERL